MRRLLLGLYFVDRVFRLFAVWHFFRPTLQPPVVWPSVTLIQPITRGTTGLDQALRSRMTLDYPGSVQQVLVCDEPDAASISTCRSILAAYAHAQAEILVLPSLDGQIASKTTKIAAGVTRARGDVLCFVDDDVRLRSATLRTFVQYLQLPQAGAVFGIACYVAWDSVWSSLMSVFVNTNALLSYIPLSYLTEPWTITGHCFALTSDSLKVVGGFEGMDDRIDDDHELARRLRRIGLCSVQTPVIYDVRNDLPSFRAYRTQMKRWFVFPRQAMLPTMSQREQAATLFGSIGNLIPPGLAVLALARRKRSDLRSLLVSLALYVACYSWCQSLYLQRATPPQRWPLVPLMGLLAPLEVILALVSDDQVEWRGRRLRIHRGGTFEVVE